jgi:hypothetical protein
MKHRHKLQQQQRRNAAPARKRTEVEEAQDEQTPGVRKAKKRPAPQMNAEGNRPRHRLDKRGRGKPGQRRFASGGTADDPGGEIAAADRDRKAGLLDRIKNELSGPKPAYARGGKTARRRFDVGGVAGPLAGSMPGGVPMPSAPNFQIAPGVALGKGPPAAPPPFVDNSVDQLLGQIGLLKSVGAFDKPKKSSNSDGDNSSNNDSSNRHGGRIRSRRAGGGSVNADGQWINPDSGQPVGQQPFSANSLNYLRQAKNDPELASRVSAVKNRDAETAARNEMEKFDGRRAGGRIPKGRNR